MVRTFFRDEEKSYLYQDVPMDLADASLVAIAEVIYYYLKT